MTVLNCLHLTDLHRGQDWYSDCIYPNVEEVLVEDLKRVHEYTGDWDLVLFTGDLVQSGGGHKGDEFRLLDDTLRALWDEFGKLGSLPQLLTVPGNHDLVWPDPRRAAVKLLRRWDREPDVQKSFWTDEKSEYRQVVDEAFTGYRSWLEKERPVRLCPVTHGLLPGDFATTFEKEGWRIGIVGLNSTFLQLSRHKYEGKLALHPVQLGALCGERYADWFQQHHLCLLMTHHPPEWLNQESKEELAAHIAPPGRFQVHLCGHLHLGWSESVARGGQAGPLLLRGGSLFGLKRYERRTERLYGYTVLQFDLGEEGAAFRYWPRLAVRRAGGHWKLDRNPSAADQFEADDGTMVELLQLRQLPRTHTADRSGGEKPGRETTSAVPADYEKLLKAFTRTIDTAKVLTSRLWEDMRSHVFFEGQRIEWRVASEGDTTVTAEYCVSGSRPVQFVPYEVVADESTAPMGFFNDVGFKVRSVDPNDGEVFYLQTENLPWRKACAIFFVPEIVSHQMRRIEVSYSWPQLLGRLVKEGKDELHFEWRRPVKEGEIILCFTAELGDVRCSLRGPEEGTSLRRRRHSDGRLTWKFRCRNAPPGSYILLLERVGSVEGS